MSELVACSNCKDYIAEDGKKLCKKCINKGVTEIIQDKPYCNCQCKLCKSGEHCGADFDAGFGWITCEYRPELPDDDEYPVQEYNPDYWGAWYE